LPELVYHDDARKVWLYHGNSLELLDAIAAKYPEGRFDAIFADPPYFLSNGGITCHAGKMVKVDKGDWDVSRGPELNHEFNTEWLRRCQRVLKPNGTIWVTGTHHVIFSIGYALQQLGFKILNDIAWEKPNPPPNLSCRYFTHSTETVLWAAKNEKSKHVFNYQEMRKVTGKQMKTVWRKEEFTAKAPSEPSSEEENPEILASSASWRLDPVWTLSAPSGGEKTFGKHPTQKPVALVERCLLASTNEGDLVLDPFLGNGTTAVASLRLKRGCVGIELDLHHVEIAARRADREIIEIWLRHFRVRVEISVFGRAGSPLHAAATRHSSRVTPQIDLDLFSDSINGSRDMADVPEIPTERIFHECKFVFLSCAQVERGAVVHTTVDVSLQEAWAKTSTGKKRETTHIVRCETEIFRVKSS
jgi:site-specific DNA-methyltransferase (adenine-specific)